MLGQGEAFDVIWTRPASQPVALGQDSTGELIPTRIGLNRESMFVDLKSLGVHDSPHMGKSAQPTVHVLVDGCPAQAPVVLPLQLQYNGQEGRLLLPRGGIPRGDLDVSFSAFGDEYTMLLANDDRGLRVIDFTERRDVQIIPGDPAIGKSDTVVSIHHDCPKNR